MEVTNLQCSESQSDNLDNLELPVMLKRPKVKQGQGQTRYRDFSSQGHINDIETS